MELYHKKFYQVNPPQKTRIAKSNCRTLKESVESTKQH